MMMTVDEKLHAYAKNQKDRNIDEKKLQQTIIKSKEALVVCSRGSITNPLDDNVLIRQ